MDFLGLALILYFAYIADFILQDRKTAQNKSKNIHTLMYHVNIIIGLLFFPCWIVFGLKFGAGVGFIMAIFFSVFNGLIHGVIDWNIWKGYKKHVAKNIKLYFETIAPDDLDEKYSSIKDYTEEELKFVFMKEKMYAEDKKFYDTIGLDGYLHTLTIILLYAWFI
ncbi:MAG: DUF3307 domain-containing protein [Lachnospiraceae bacterium]|nr:DUF3307 domain-containing protein [Lachnospiraceae bacterium]